MTERQDTERTDEEYRPTLGEMSHTDPYADDAFGATQTYRRGRFVAADGGRDPDRESDGDGDAEAEAETEERPDEDTLQDVDHTPPEDSDGAAPVYERGHEGKEDVR